MIEHDAPLPSRITGTEMEWGLMTKSGPRDDFETGFRKDDFADIIGDNVPSYIVGAKTYYSNGSRFYQDVGDHLEYATPECGDFRQTVAHELAGEKIVYDTLDRICKIGTLEDFTLNKRVADDNDNTWGYHESYCSQTGTINIQPDELALLGLHLATRNLYTGAGVVRRTGAFNIAQKVVNLNIDASTSTHFNDQPLLSLRDEPHAAGLQKRIHVTSGDANISPWATWMKLGTTSLVLRLMEQNVKLPALALDMPLYQLAKAVGADDTTRRIYRLQDGRRVRPVDLQWNLFENASKLGVEAELPREEYEVLAEWERALTDLERDPELLADRADWVLKRKIIRNYADNNKLKSTHKKLRAKDRHYDQIGPRGLADTLRKKFWQNYTPDASEVDVALYEAPRTTRAYTRGRAIRALAFESGFDVAWDYVSSKGRKYPMWDPNHTKFPQIDKLLS